MKLDKKEIYLPVIGIILIIIDRLTKRYAGNILDKASTIIPTNNSFLIFFSFVLIIIILILYFRVELKEKLALMIMLSGIISNLIDRIVYGYVINLNFLSIFNFADVCIDIGLILLIVVMIKNMGFKKKK